MKRTKIPMKQKDQNDPNMHSKYFICHICKIWTKKSYYFHKCVKGHLRCQTFLVCARWRNHQDSPSTLKHENRLNEIMIARTATDQNQNLLFVLPFHLLFFFGKSSILRQRKEKLGLRKAQEGLCDNIALVPMEMAWPLHLITIKTSKGHFFTLNTKLPCETTFNA